MKFPKKFILPLSVVALVGACAPYPPFVPYEEEPANVQPPAEQQTILDVKKQEEAATTQVKKEVVKSTSTTSLPKPTPAPVKTYYPTAAKVPGKDGFVFNPFTQSLVNVKGIASGKLVRDPEDPDATHKFRVP